LQPVAKKVDVALRGASLNREGGFDAARQRQMSCKAGLLPTSPAKPRHRQAPKRGRKRLCNAVIQA
jgi:hypothetical protein